MDLDLSRITSSSMVSDSPAMRWPRYAPPAHSVELKLPKGYKRSELAVVERYLSQMLDSGKSQLCKVDLLKLEGRGPADAQLIQQLWATMPTISRVVLRDLQSPTLLQHMTMLCQLQKLCILADLLPEQKDKDVASPLDFQRPQPMDGRLDLLSPLTNLRHLRLFGGGGWREGNMSHLSTLVHLTQLECWKWDLEMVARDLQHLTTLTAMQHLSLTGYTDSGPVELYLDPLQHMSHLTCLELYSKTGRLHVGNWHAVGRPDNVVKRLYLPEVQVIVPNRSPPRVHWQCLQELDTWVYTPDPLFLSVLQLHEQQYGVGSPPAIKFKKLSFGRDHDPSVLHDAVNALRVLGVTSFTFKLSHIHQVSLLEPLGQQLTQLELGMAYDDDGEYEDEYEDDYEDEYEEDDRDDEARKGNVLTQQHAMALAAALPRLQELEVHGIKDGGGAEALLRALGELKVLRVVDKEHAQAWHQAVQAANLPQLSFKIGF